MAFTHNVHEFSLDIKSQNASPLVLVRGDIANVLYVTVTENGSAVDLTGVPVMAVFYRSDGQRYVQTMHETSDPIITSGESGIVTIPLKNQSYADGDNKMEIVLLNSNETAALSTTSQATIRARNSIITDEAVISSTEYPLLMTLISALRNMDCTATTLSYTADATGSIALGSDGVYHLTFGIPRGESAYETAVEGGYTGTEADFKSAMASVVTVTTNASNAATAANNAATSANSAATAANNAASSITLNLAPTFSTSAAYAEGEYVTYSGTVYRFVTAHSAGAWNAGEAVAVKLAEEIEELRENWVLVKPVNWLDETKLTTGKFMKPDGTTSSNSSYCYTAKIAVQPGDTVRIRRRTNISDYHVANYALTYLCAFDASGNAVSASGINGTSTSYYTVPSNIYAVVVSTYTAVVSNGLGMIVINGDDELEYTPYFEPYWEAKDKFMSRSYGAVVSAAVGKSPRQNYAASMSNGSELVCGSTFARKNKIITFRAMITTVGQFTVWNATGSGYFDSKVVIDGTNVTAYSAAGSGYVQVFTAAHGLTLTDYVSVEIAVDTAGASRVRITTNGGEYTHDGIGFNGKDTVKVTSEGAVFTKAYLSWTVKDLKQPLWIFGDSYTQLSNSLYWTKQLADEGYTNYLLCGFPGAKSMNMYAEWRNCLNYGTPKYALWAMGMNDSDSTAVNFEWERYFKLFLEDCDRLGITPIAATIPNVPDRNHTYKNAIVEGTSRLRYVDFAEAVGAESAGSSWFTGMLQSDNVHPTTQGAKCLAAQVLAQLPEITQ